MQKFALVFATAAAALAQSSFRLEELDLAQVKSLAPPMGYPAAAGRAVSATALRIHGAAYAHGVGLHSGSTVVVDLRGAAERFEALAGVDDGPTALPKPLPGSAMPRGLQTHPGTGRVEVWVDGALAADTGVMRRGAAAVAIRVDLVGKRRLTIVVGDGGRWPYNNPVDLVDAAIVAKAKPVALAVPQAAMPVVADARDAAPAIHGPRVVGGSVGKPFLFRIPATGDGALRFATANLPAGLEVNAKTGLITGALQSAGRTAARITVSSAQGKDSRELEIVAG